MKRMLKEEGGGVGRVILESSQIYIGWLVMFGFAVWKEREREASLWLDFFRRS